MLNEKIDRSLITLFKLSCSVSEDKDNSLGSQLELPSIPNPYLEELANFTTSTSLTISPSHNNLQGYKTVTFFPLSRRSFSSAEILFLAFLISTGRSSDTPNGFGDFRCCLAAFRTVSLCLKSRKRTISGRGLFALLPITLFPVGLPILWARWITTGSEILRFFWRNSST